MNTTLLECAVCLQQLHNPITLSCGYTICKSCLPLDMDQQKTFVCPVQQCTKQTHLFGPTLLIDQVINKITQTDYNHEKLTELLACPIGKHSLEYPITTHCGHTFCKLCLLQYKISNDSCNVCQKRLPSYQFIQHQSQNYLLSSIIPPSLDNCSVITSSNHLAKNTISFMTTPTCYENISIHLINFPVLPTQKLWLSIYTENHRQFFLQSLLLNKQRQSLCFAILEKVKVNHKSRFGTIVRINTIKQRENDVMIQITGLDRFKVDSVRFETDDHIRADITTQFERPLIDDDNTVMGDPISLPPSPTLCHIKGIITAITPPSSPTYIQDTNLSNTIHDFINTLSLTSPSNAFCNTVEGLLGPVWLESVQEKYGVIPSAEDPISLCWWSSIVLPIGVAERSQILQTKSLNLRLRMVLSWMNGMKSKWVQCRQTAMNSALRATGN